MRHRSSRTPNVAPVRTSLGNCRQSSRLILNWGVVEGERTSTDVRSPSMQKLEGELR